MKRLLAIVLAVIMCVALGACATNNNAGDNNTTDNTTDNTTNNTTDNTTDNNNTSDTKGDFSGDVTLKVMLMPQGEMTSDGIAKVTEAVNNRIKELGYEFKVEFVMSGPAGWDFTDLDTALQTGNAPDIFPAHSWSGSVTYTIGAMAGQYMRLDDPENNLLEKYGPALYGNTAPAFKDAAVIPGNKGDGIYAYIIEKDGVSTLGYFVNKTELEALGFTLADFKADDLASWEPLLKAYKEKYPDKYALNVEAEVMDRTVNHTAHVSNTIGPLGFAFDNANPAGTEVAVSSRYENPTYKDFINTMHGYYNAGYVDPDLGIVGDVSAKAVQAHRDSGDYLICNFVYTPGQEKLYSKTASDKQGKDVEIAWVPGWSTPIATTDNLIASGLAVSAGTRYAPEAVTFLNMSASDKVMGDLLTEGIAGVSYEIKDGINWRLEGRGGWSIWRYGVAGSATQITPLGDLGANGEELENLREFNNAASGLAVGWLFDVSKVDAQNSACIATIDKYAIPLGSGAADPAQYDAFIAELKAVGIDEVVAEAKAQFDAWSANQ